MEASTQCIGSRKDSINSYIISKAVNGNKLDLINRECLLDALQALYDECSLETLQKYDKQICQFVDRYKNTMLELKRLRVNITDFEIKTHIGRGHFGDVHVVKEKQTGDVYALKTIKKCDSLEKTSFIAEREIMAFSNSPWITSLQYAFQDSNYLFFVMEYHPGGDLLALLYRQGGTLPETAATFYIAELVLALEDLHAMGYVHRDIKPDNILLDRCGHLKLVDFGSAAKLNPQGFVDKGIPVGTPDYIAPEVLNSVEDKKNSAYGVSCDYWSLGILAYELTVGKAPFSGQNTTTTYSRIMNHGSHLKFPSDVLLTQAYNSFVRSLITDQQTRLKGQQVKQHVLFKNVHFETLRDQVPPYVPKITCVDDVSNFNDVTAKKMEPSMENFKKKTQFSGRNLPFVGFTFTPDFNSCERSFDRSALARDEVIRNMKEDMESMRRDLLNNEDFEGVKFVLEKKVMEKEHKLESIVNVRDQLERDLASSIAECSALKRTLEIERNDRADLERKALDLIKSAKLKWETSERSKVSTLTLEIEQQKEKIVQLTTTNNMLNEQLQRAFRLENRHKESLEAVEKLNRRSVIGLESRLEKVAQDTTHKITSLQTNLDDAINHKRALEVEIANLKDKERSLEKKLERSSKEYEAMNKAANEAEKLIKELGKKVGEFEKEIEMAETLRLKISQLMEKIHSQEDNIKQLERVNVLLKDESKIMEDYKNELESFKDHKVQNEKKIHELESKLHEEQEKCKSLEEQLKNSETLKEESQQLKELRLQMWKTEKELGNAKIDKRIVERELKEATAQIKSVDAEIDALNARNLESKKAHEAAMLEMSSINESLSLELIKLRESSKNMEYKLECEHSKSEQDKMFIEQLKDALDSKDENIKECVKKVNFYRDELVLIQNHCVKLDEEKCEAAEEVSEVKKDNQRLVREAEEMKSQLENAKMNLEALREACLLIESQVIEYEKINASIEAEKASAAKNTEKLINDLCSAKEDIQEAKKSANEEKSAKLWCETKIKHLNEDIECLQNECRSYKDQCLTYKECSNNLSEELTASEEKVTDLEVTVRSYERQIEELVSEINLLKEEISQYLTQLSGLKESNFKVKQQVQELKGSKNVLMEQVDELEGTLNAKVNYYEDRELKHNSIIKQQTKLIDYLQIKIDEHGQKKKTFTDILFGSSKKENQPPISLPINYKDLECQLQKQKQINKDLQEEVYRLKAELNCKTSVAKVTRHRSEILSPQTKFAMEQLGKSPISSKSDILRQNSVQRMYHNIPHRFTTKLCKVPIQCDHCSLNVAFGREMSVCVECEASAHPHCAESLRGTCGLPKAYAKHFKESLSKVKDTDERADGSDAVDGWIKVLRNETWEKRYACLTESRFDIYADSSMKDGELVRSLDFRVPDSKRKVVLEPVPSEIGVSVASSDLPFIIKVEISTDCWPPVSLLFMALSMPDRDKWFKALQKLFGEESDKYHIEPVMSIPERLYINCVVDLTKNIKVLGTDQGLYSYYNNFLLHIEGLSQVHHICTVPDTKIVVMIADNNGILVSCDLNHLINVTQCAPCTKPTLTYKDIPIKNLDGFHFLQGSNGAKHQMFCAATSKQMALVKYDLETNDFVPLRVMDTAEPLGCVLFTEHTLIVGADKFFEIDLDSFKAEEFLDGSDLRLKHVVKCHKIRSFPIAILQIFINPKEYLLCFNEFTVFVDEYGQSSNSKEIKLNSVPVCFHFIEPYLYVVKFCGVEIFRLIEDRDSAPSVNIDLRKMRYLGKCAKGIYVFHEDKVKLLEGRKLMDCDDVSSVVSQSTENVDESDRFSFTSSMVQSLDGNLSDCENSSIEERNGKKVTFSQTNL